MNTRKLMLACAASACWAAAGAAADSGSVLDHMHDHYDAVLEIQAAVIAGSLDRVREPARWLAEHEAPANLPAGAGKFVDAMRAAAREALAAEDLATAATATTRLGLACGGCHSANNVTIEFESASRPSDKDKPKAHMQRHQWAADRMWEGLIGPNNLAWSRGADLLFESPMHPEELGGEAGDEAVLGMARRIHQLAANATAVRGPEKKADIYAEFLANCAACHTALGEGPAR